MSEDYSKTFYGAASSIQKDLSEWYRQTEKNLFALNMWSTKLCETVVVLLDFGTHRPMVGIVVRVWQRFVEEGSQLFYWKEVNVDAHWEENSTDLMKYFDDKSGKWIRRDSK